MEKAKKTTMIPASFGWSDVGAWDEVAQMYDKDKYGNSAVGSNEFYFTDVQNTYVVSESHINKVVAAVGIDNLAIIDTPDALLVMHREKSENLKAVVKDLQNGPFVSMSELPATVHRPWGDYTTLTQRRFPSEKYYFKARAKI